MVGPVLRLLLWLSLLPLGFMLLLCALGLCFRHSRRRSLRISGILLAAFLCIPVIALILRPPQLDHDDLPILKNEGNAILQRLQAFRAAEGRYPAGLIAAGIDVSPTRYGPWRYHLRDNARSFELSLGHYLDNGFTLFWDSKAGYWYLDT